MLVCTYRHNLYSHVCTETGVSNEWMNATLKSWSCLTWDVSKLNERRAQRSHTAIVLERAVSVLSLEFIWLLIYFMVIWWKPEMCGKRECALELDGKMVSILHRIEKIFFFYVTFPFAIYLQKLHFMHVRCTCFFLCGFFAISLKQILLLRANVKGKKNERLDLAWQLKLVIPRRHLLLLNKIILDFEPF